MKILNRYYNAMGVANLKDLSNRYSIDITWIIEAGCHDGSDTLILRKDFPKSNIIAFEPDPASRAVAQAKFGKIESINVELHPFGLSDESSRKYLEYVDSKRGNGTTSLAESGTESVKTVSLDNFRQLPPRGGLLWLDVEGHAVKALLGMKRTLLGIDLAKVEVQMHYKSQQRKQDYSEVVEIMSQAGLIPVKAPLHPGFFGDIYFIRKSFANNSVILKSKLLKNQMMLLHNTIYPLLGKPKADKADDFVVKSAMEKKAKFLIPSQLLSSKKNRSFLSHD